MFKEPVFIFVTLIIINNNSETNLKCTEFITYLAITVSAALSCVFSFLGRIQIQLSIDLITLTMMKFHRHPFTLI